PAAPVAVFLLPLSAHDPEALKARAADFRSMLADDGDSLAAVCQTASVRRTHHDHRLAIVGNRAEMIEQLWAFGRDEDGREWIRARANGECAGKLAFVFSGQGPQWWAMGRELLDQERVFREMVEHCDELLRRHATWSLLGELRSEHSKSRLD